MSGLCRAHHNEEKENLKNPGLRSLFSSIKIGTITLKNRVVFSPIYMNFPKERNIEFLRVRAKGGVGLVIVGSGMLMADASENFLRVYSDEFIPELRSVATTIHEQGAKVSLQIHHQGRQTHFSGTPIAPSPIPCPVTKRLPRELTKDEVLFFIEAYAQGVRRAQEAGFDMAQLHGSHGYLINQFLSARSNQRKDEYGGDLRARARFLTEIIIRARQLVGDAFPIDCRFNASDNIEGGLTVEESTGIAQLAEQAGLTMLNISGGVYGSNPVTIAPCYTPPALYAESAGAIKRAVNIPVCVGGHIGDPLLAARIIDEGKADLIAMARPLLADPELPNKAAQGKLKDIRPCLFCNQGCMRWLDHGLEDTCTVNPWLGREAMINLTPSTRAKKVLVVGGGIAGLETARVASLRGHTVVIYEEDEAPGGQWILAAASPMKENYSRYLNWLIRQVEKSGVRIRLSKTFTIDDIATEAPDAVIVATGAYPLKPYIPGIERAVTAWDVLQNKVKVHRSALIVGASGTGLQTAHFLADRGKKVAVIEMTERIGRDMPSTVRWQLRHILNNYQIKIFPAVELKAILPEGVVVKNKDGEQLWPDFETVVLATGACSRNELKDVIQSIVPEVYVIGDAKSPRTGLEAIAEGARIGLSI